MGCIFGFLMKKYENTECFMNFGGDLGHLNDKKHLKKFPLCHFLDPQEAIVGELIFEGENGHQIQKLYMS